jgi:(2Fe-2S) ferredoxin
MNFKIVILDEAKTDFKESFNWYKNVDPKLSKRFYQSFKKSLTIIKQKSLSISN